MSEPGEPVPWRSLLEEAKRRLACVDGMESPEVDARRIVEAAAGVGPAEFDRVLDQPATTLAAARFHAMLQRRRSGEPLQCVVGSWGFRTLDLMVDHRVLVPRPETEVVAGRAIAEVERCSAVAREPRSRDANRHTRGTVSGDRRGTG